MNKAKSFAKILSLIMALIMLSSVVVLPASAASAPAAPAKIVASTSTTEIKLSWSKVSGATGYRIYYKRPGDLSWRKAVSSTNSTSHTFSGLYYGQSYLFAVRSYIKSGEKIIWGGYRQLVTSTKPTIPKHFYLESDSTNSLSLRWTDLPEATGYRIYYRTSPSASWKIAVSSTETNNHTFKGLSAGKRYYFAVRAYTQSPFGTFFGDPRFLETATKPATPETKSSSTTSSITLSWNKVSADGYRIYYKSSGSSWKIAVSTTAKTSHTFKNLPSGKAYTFAVRPYIKTPTKVIWGGYNQFNVTTTPKPKGVNVVIGDIFTDSQGRVCATIYSDGWGGKIRSNSQRVSVYVDGVEMEEKAMLQISSSTTGDGYQYVYLNLDEYEIDPSSSTITFVIPEGFLENKTGTKYNYAYEVTM